MVSGAIAAHGAKRVSQDKHDVYVSLGRSRSVWRWTCPCTMVSRLDYPPHEGLRAVLPQSLTAGITTLLTLVMGYRFSRRWKFMPAGLGAWLFLSCDGVWRDTVLMSVCVRTAGSQ